MADEVRLIDANALKDSLKELKAEGYNQKYVQGLQDAIDGYFPQIIDDMPTVDVEPVKHGRWERRMTKIYACSECTNEVTDRQRKNYSFCPYCGAIMDGDSDD